LLEGNGEEDVEEEMLDVDCSGHVHMHDRDIMMSHWPMSANVRQTLGPLKCPKAWSNTSGKLERIFHIKRHL